MIPSEEPARLPRVWGFSTIIRIGASAVVWVILWAATTAGMLALAYVVSPFGPSCVSSRPGVPPHVTVTDEELLIVPLVVATLLVGLYWALAVRGHWRRLAAVIVVAAVVTAAGVVGEAVTPMCT